ncbi:MAG: hypothetical protein ACRDRH_23480 [Pseudonocardia sp.]
MGEERQEHHTLPDNQAILDTTLSQASDDAQARFALLVSDRLPADAPATLATNDSLHFGTDGGLFRTLKSIFKIRSSD